MRSQLDFFVTPLCGPVVAGDQSHPMKAPKVPVGWISFHALLSTYCRASISRPRVCHSVLVDRVRRHGCILAQSGRTAGGSGGSGAGASPDPAPAVGGTGGEGCGRRVRAARMINAVLPAVTSTPPRSTPIAIQSRKDILAPTSMSAATPREASEFMRTTDQSPSRTFHVSVWVPTPEAEAAQKRWSGGGPWGAPPRSGRGVTRTG